MKAISDLEQRPTFTFCLKNKDKFPEKDLIIRRLNLIIQSVVPNIKNQEPIQKLFIIIALN
jgi:hypothetical protein